MGSCAISVSKISCCGYFPLPLVTRFSFQGAVSCSHLDESIMDFNEHQTMHKAFILLFKEAFFREIHLDFKHIHCAVIVNL